LLSNKKFDVEELIPKPQKIADSTSWVSRDWKQLRSAFFGGPVYVEVFRLEAFYAIKTIFEFHLSEIIKD
jgi:hypothetical protein